MARAVSGDAITNAALGAVQVAAGLVARALTVAIPSGDMGLLRPSVLYDIGFDLIRRGQSLFGFSVLTQTAAPSCSERIQADPSGLRRTGSALVEVRSNSGRSVSTNVRRGRFGIGRAFQN